MRLVEFGPLYPYVATRFSWHFACSSVLNLDLLRAAISTYFRVDRNISALDNWMSSLFKFSSFVLSITCFRLLCAFSQFGAQITARMSSIFWKIYIYNLLRRIYIAPDLIFIACCLLTLTSKIGFLYNFALVIAIESAN